MSQQVASRRALVLGSLLPLLCHQVAAQQLFPGERFALGSVGTGAGVSADFDADGLMDLATANLYGDNVSVVLGNGVGGFGAPLLLPAGDGPVAIATADFDGDGAADLATVQRDGNDVSVRLGAGDGTFGALASFPVGAMPQDLVAADADADGHVDLLTADDLGRQVSVLLGDGTGSFAPAQASLTAFYNPVSLDAGHLDGDADLDLALTVYDEIGLLVMFGDGSGGFSAPVSQSYGGGASNVTIADADGDGFADLLTTAATSAQVELLAGDGSGAFAQGALIPTLARPLSVRCFDVDGDGLLDLLTANDEKYSDYAGTVTLLLATAPGAYAPPRAWATGGSNRFVAATDTDGDGWLDLVTPNGGHDVTVLRATGPGSFAAAHVVKPHLDATRDIELADLDADGLEDIVACGFYEHLTVHKAMPGGGFEAPAFYFGTFESTGVAIGDLDSDAHVDAVTCNVDGTVSVHRGDGDGGFAPATHLPASTQLAAVALGDMNGDGALDITTVDTGIMAWLLLNDGSGGFLPATSHKIGKVTLALEVADVNADGALDIVALKTHLDGDDASNVTVLRGNGAGGFQPPLTTPLPPDQDSMTLGDVNADGLPDLITSGPSLQVRPGDGSGLFGAPMWEYATTTSPATFTDVNGDGRGDLVTGDGSKVQVRHGDGVTGFAEPLSYTATSSAGVFAAGDMNGDGAADLAVASHAQTESVSSAISVLFNLSPGWAWSTLGAGLAGTHGIPALAGDGALVAGNTVSLALTGALEHSVGALVVGLAAVHLPFQGGVLVPAADIVFPAVPIGSSGELTLSSAWPALVPTGIQVFFQYWVMDPAAAQGFAASNAVVCTSP
jgi:hypothetical protein